jgi:hypothetical protein
VGWTVQVVPFHRSANDVPFPRRQLPPYQPTAVHAVLLGQDTPDR